LLLVVVVVVVVVGGGGGGGVADMVVVPIFNEGTIVSVRPSYIPSQFISPPILLN
jgi:hypothetical protein